MRAAKNRRWYQILYYTHVGWRQERRCACVSHRPSRGLLDLTGVVVLPFILLITLDLNAISVLDDAHGAFFPSFSQCVSIKLTT